MKKLTSDKSSNIFLKLFLLITPFAMGGYHIWVSALLSVLLCGYLTVNAVNKKSGQKIQVGISLLSILLIPVFYLISSLWAVDSGTAVYGFVKFLPAALFALAVSDCTKEEKTELLGTVPVSAIIMGIVSYGLSFIPQLSEYFLVAERLGGFFQYPNSFAIYCLTGIAVLLLKERVTYKEWIMTALLVAIILLTGSRTAFVFLIAVFAVIFFRLTPKNRIRLSALLGGAIALSLIAVLVTGNMQTVGRYLTISLESSTLLGRLLYYRDALPVILKNPLGLGYYGYYFSQASFQTGVYSTAFVHNEFLQLLLDIGWVPSLLFFFAAAMSFFSKGTTVLQKTVMFIILGHSFFDFDLQFISVFLVLILTFDFGGKRIISVRLKDTAVFGASLVLVLVSLYFGIINALFLCGEYGKVEKIYGRDTQSQIYLMSLTDSYSEISAYADSILSRNEYMAIAYDAKANEAYKKGDIKSVIENKQKAISCTPYKISEYNDYCKKLINIITVYTENGDTESAEYCIEELLALREKLEETAEKTSSLGWKIKDKPELELDIEYQRYIKELE